VKEKFLSKEPCPHCAGTGKRFDGSAIANWCLREMDTWGFNRKQAAKKLGITPSYFTDLIYGRRRWTAELIAKLEKVIG
jgi:hypothetical protein